MPLLKRKAEAGFTLQIDDMQLRVRAPEGYYEECRATALSVWEQVQAYGIQNPSFRTSKKPVAVPETAPAVIQEIAAIGRAAGVGPLFMTRGALTDYVGRHLTRSLSEVMVSCGGHYFFKMKRATKLPVVQDARGEPLCVTVDSKGAPRGVTTSYGRDDLPDSVDGLAVLASSCMLADAAAAAAAALLARPGSFKRALQYLKRLEGVQGALLIQGNRFGVAGRMVVAH